MTRPLGQARWSVPLHGAGRTGDLGARLGGECQRA